ncbi:MAG: hypothetical protein FWD21_02340 [Peptococcaceae bacterium]|nr:hypothetical protein [Peptococcaceae bacterium]
MSAEFFYWLAFLLLLLGIITLFLDIFIFTGFGVAGLSGIIFIIWGVVLLAVDATQLTAALAISLVGGIILFLVGLKLMTRFKMWNRLTLSDKQQNQEGYVAPDQELSKYTGMEGVALTPLRPAGTAEIDGNRIDVVTDGEFIPKGARIIVGKVEGLRVVVKEIGS